MEIYRSMDELGRIAQAGDEFTKNKRGSMLLILLKKIKMIYHYNKKESYKLTIKI